jgi:opacity protein-like surface antigen
MALSAGALAPAAQAADFGAPGPVYGNIGGYVGPTPVPAPIPVPVYEPEWYFRADFAAGFGADPSVTVQGINFAQALFGPGVGSSKSFEPSFVGGVGVGYIWGPCFRTDLTVDLHSIMSTQLSGDETYVNASGLQERSVQDKTKLMSTILLANAYYDIRTGTAFTPYIGAGLGFAVNQITRSFTFVDTGPDVDVSVSDRSTQVQFAGAAMAGLTYDINSFVALDVNYRYLFIGGPSLDLTIFNVGSRLEIGGISEQQIRAGLRFYVD